MRSSKTPLPLQIFSKTKPENSTKNLKILQKKRQVAGR
jgi:hypothetical protein